MNRDNGAENEKKKNFRYIIRGDFLVEDFIFEQRRFFIWIMVLAVFFISNKYSCMQKQVEIETLKEQLKDIKCENLSVSAEWAFHSRLSQIEKLLESRGMELAVSVYRTFELKK